MKWYGVNHCTLISFVSILTKIVIYALSERNCSKGEIFIMTFIIYVHNLQQLYMRALQGKFVLHKTT